jgi:hypothetical protein
MIAYPQQEEVIWQSGPRKTPPDGWMGTWSPPAPYRVSRWLASWPQLKPKSRHSFKAMKV